MACKEGFTRATAIEPNGDLLSRCKSASSEYPFIQWLASFAEHTGLDNQALDWITMESSFHWADFDTATKEFYRILRPHRRFTALWSPRLIEANPLLVEIENRLNELQPKIQSASSGRSCLTSALTKKLSSSPYFKDIAYIEGQHTITMTLERFISALRSVNDIHVQLGVEKFGSFTVFIEKRGSGIGAIEARYLTPAWTAQRKH